MVTFFFFFFFFFLNIFRVVLWSTDVTDECINIYSLI